MRTQTIVFVAIVVTALLVGACGPTTINQAAPPAVRSLNVNGTGQVYLTPDIAYIYIGVHTEKANAAEAVEANTAETQKVIAALKQAGVEAKDIQTTNFSIWPNTQYGPEGQQIGVNYVVDNSVYVTVRNLDNLGSLLDAAVSAGANSINSIQFDVADKSQALKQARDAALENARTQAQELAAAAGVKLGDIQSISFYDSSAAPYFDTFGGKGGGGGMETAAVPIQPGQLTLTVTVSLTYEIK
jgi:uncharacterized protein YggE